MFLLKLRLIGKPLSFWLLFAALFIYAGVFSQSEDKYELLWEIQHKDSEQKSYLFGTMHLADKRIFNFSDALLPAILNSDAFALELHPDVILHTLYKDLEKKEQSENFFKRILSDEEYQRLDERFKNINGTSIEDYPNLHYYLIETMIYPDTVREDDMITIVDSYLYGLAAMFDKEIYGLEEVENQLPPVENIGEIDEVSIRESIVKLLEISDEEYLDIMEEMIEIYSKGNLTRLFNYMAEDTLDANLKFRNRVMTNSMKDIMANKTLFAAVGAAHLPGESGILRMLENDGYVVNRVDSPFTGVSTQIELKPNLQQWYKEHNNELGFSVTTPTKPYAYTVDQSFEIFTTIDLVTNSYLMYFVIDLTDINETEDPETLLDTFLNDYYGLENTEIIENKTATHPEGFKKIYYKDGDTYKRVLAGISNRHLYVFFTENKRLASLNSVFAEAFFNSVKIFEPIKRKAQWREIKDSQGAFTVLLPNSNIQKSTNKVPSPYEEDGEPIEIHLYMSVDDDTKTNFLFRYFDQPTGYFLDNIHVVLGELKTIYSTLGTLQSEPRLIQSNGQKFYELEIFTEENYHLVTRVYFRGNRQYLLMAAKDEPGERVNKSGPFFNSFHFNEFSGEDLGRTITFDKKYSVAFPKNMKTVLLEDFYEGTAFKINNKYFGNNPHSGSTYVVEHIKLKPYFRAKNLEEYYSTYDDEFYKEGDEILVSELTELNGLEAKKLVYKNENSGVYRHFLILLDNDNFFTLQVYSTGEEQELVFVENFFNSFTKKTKRNHFDYSSSKASQILKDLNSRNRNKQANARDAFNYYYFDKDDLLVMEQFVANSYKDDEDYDGIKSTVIKEFAYINDSEAVLALSRLYNNPNTTNIQKVTILETMPKIESDIAFQNYTQLLFENPPHLKNDSPMVIFDGFHNDTIPLSNYIEPLSQLMAVPEYRNELIYLVNSVIKSDTLVFDKIKAQSAVWLKHFKTDLETYLAEPDFDNNRFFNIPLLYNYVEMIDTLRVNNPSISKGLNIIATSIDKQEWLKTKAVIAQLNLKLNPDNQVLNELLENNYSRFEIMEALVNNDKNDLIPENYLDAKAFSELSLYNFIGLYTDFPEIISHLGEFTENNKTFHAFSFEVDEEPGVSYLAVVEENQINFEDFKQFNVFFDGSHADGNWQSLANTMVLQYSYYSE